MVDHGRGLVDARSTVAGWRRRTRRSTLQDVLADPGYRDLGQAKVATGDIAPDFELPVVDGGATVCLGTLLDERPVALVFGSYT